MFGWVPLSPRQRRPPRERLVGVVPGTPAPSMRDMDSPHAGQTPAPPPRGASARRGNGASPQAAHTRWAVGRAAVGDLRSTVSSGWTWVGVAGGLLIAASWVGLPTIATDLGTSGLPDRLLRSVTLTRIVPLLGIVALVIAWLRLIPRGGGRPARWLIVLWSLPFLLLPVGSASDFQAYVDVSWILHTGHDPYTTPMGSIPGPMGPYTAVWAGTTTPYPPLSLLLAELVAVVTNFSPHAFSIVLRLVALAAVLALAATAEAVARLLGRSPALAGWLGAANPVTVICGVGEAHNDVWGVLVVAVAIWLLLRLPRYPALAITAVGVACAFKQSMILALVIPMLLPGRGQYWSRRLVGRLLWRAFWMPALAVCTFAAVSVLSGLGFGWQRGLASTSAAANYSLTLPLRLWAAVEPQQATAVLLALALVIALIAAAKLLPGRPFDFAAIAIPALTVLGPALNAWYALLPLLVIAWARPPIAIRVGVATVAGAGVASVAVNYWVAALFEAAHLPMEGVHKLAAASILNLVVAIAALVLSSTSAAAGLLNLHATRQDAV